ncbi:uncharacterized protein M6B38_311325 [Iris pallida]|uniref:Uncharacterized protein n=1 Tax=Iris pallida TaxID=29817 RepID=A0AAX6HH70_IRIPA|nr:uncharacterized protein M6B38_311325 [Iris pallida]
MEAAGRRAGLREVGRWRPGRAAPRGRGHQIRRAWSSENAAGSGQGGEGSAHRSPPPRSFRWPGPRLRTDLASGCSPDTSSDIGAPRSTPPGGDRGVA